MSSASLRQEQRQYQALKSNLLVVVNNLSSAKNYISIAKNDMEKNYLLDMSSADDNEVANNEDELAEMINKINSNVIPEIDRVIQRLERAIEEALAAEAAAAAAAAAAAEAAKAAASTSSSSSASSSSGTTVRSTKAVAMVK